VERFYSITVVASPHVLEFPGYEFVVVQHWQVAGVAQNLSVGDVKVMVGGCGRRLDHLSLILS
jgi:hypothetical protein